MPPVIAQFLDVGHVAVSAFSGLRYVMYVTATMPLCYGECSQLGPALISSSCKYKRNFAARSQPLTGKHRDYRLLNVLL